MSIAYFPQASARAEAEDETGVYVCRGSGDCYEQDGPCPFCVKLCQSSGVTSATALITGCEVWGAGVTML